MKLGGYIITVRYIIVFVCVNTSGQFTAETVSYFKSEGPGSSLKSAGFSSDQSQLDPGDSDLSFKPLVIGTPVSVTGSPSSLKKLDKYTAKHFRYSDISELIINSQ